MVRASFQPSDTVCHQTYGPGKITHVSSARVHVTFRDGRQESFGLNHAKEVLLTCPPQGFIASLMNDEQSTLRLLSENPREAFSLLSTDLGREVTPRNAKTLFKSSKIITEQQLNSLWPQVAKTLKKPGPKQKRILQETGPVIASPAEATELTRQLWDTSVHISDRTAVFDTLAKFFSEPWSEDFFLEASIMPVPVARSLSYKDLKARERLHRLWEFIVRKTPNERNASGIIDVLLRLIADRQPIPALDHRVAADVFLQALASLPTRSDRLERLRDLFFATSGPVRHLAKEVLARFPVRDLVPHLPKFSPSERDALFQLRYEDAVLHEADRADPTRLIDFLRHLKGRVEPRDIRRVVEAALSGRRIAWAQQVLATGIDALSSTADPSDLELLKGWVLSKPELIDAGVSAAFERAGLTLAPAPPVIGPEDHEQQLLDAARAPRQREAALTRLLETIGQDDVVRILPKLLEERSERGNRLGGELWDLWARRNPTSTFQLIERTLNSSNRAPVFNWLLDTGRLPDLEDDLPSLLAEMIIRYGSDRLPGDLREILQRSSTHPISAATRQLLLQRYLDACTRLEPPSAGSMRDALAALGVPSDVLDLVCTQLYQVSTSARQLEENLSRAQRTLKDFTASEEFRNHVRKEVEASMQAKLIEARGAWEMTQDKFRLELAGWYVDFAVLVDAIRTSRDIDIKAVASALLRRIDSMLESLFDLELRGTIGDEVRFDPSVHEGPAEPGAPAILLRPLLVSKKSGRAVQRALVRAK